MDFVEGLLVEHAGLDVEVSRPGTVDGSPSMPFGSLIDVPSI